MTEYTTPPGNDSDPILVVYHDGQKPNPRMIYYLEYSSIHL